MATKKTAKATEAKKAAEPKAKKTTKTTKTTAKAKAATKTKKTAAKKKPTEEETPSNEVEVTPESEEVTEEPVEQQPEEAEEPEEVEEAEEPEEEPAPEEVKPAPPAPESVRESVDDDKINAHRIFITRIAFEATKDDLEEYFKKFGTVYDAYCPKQNSYSALNKGFGFISFDSEESIQKVFETSPHIIMGREVIVDRATAPGTSASKRPFPPPRRFRDFPDHRFKRHPEPYAEFPPKFRKDRHFEREPYNPTLPPYRQNSASSTFDPNKPVSFVFSGSRSDTRTTEPFRFPNPKFRDRNIPKLFVGRIGFETTVQSLRSYFSQFGEVIDVYIPKDAQTQRGKGFGFLTFASKSSIHTVLDPNLKHVLDGREIIVDYADVHSRRL